MTHWILQFALRIAVRSVLHRCASLDIHCWKLLSSKSKDFRPHSINQYLGKGLKTKVHQLVHHNLHYNRPTFVLLTPVPVSKNENTSSVTALDLLTVHVDSFLKCGNDPSAGSPTETLLRLHLPLNNEIKKSFHKPTRNKANKFTVPIFHRVIQSVGATGGVYKGQGRNQRKLMTCIY